MPSSATSGPPERVKADRGAGETRRRILAAARDLFAKQGYAGTSIADIAGRLGTSKAALYYHFPSKADIAEALLAEPLAAFGRLAESAEGGDPAVLLGAVIDTTAELHAGVDVIGSDRSMGAELRHVAARSREINATITGALAGPGPDAASTVRAHAAYAVAKNGTLALMSGRRGRLTRADREQILGAALRALTPDGRITS